MCARPAGVPPCCCLAPPLVTLGRASILVLATSIRGAIRRSRRRKSLLLDGTNSGPGSFLPPTLLFGLLLPRLSR